MLAVFYSYCCCSAQCVCMCSFAVDSKCRVGEADVYSLGYIFNRFNCDRRIHMLCTCVQIYTGPQTSQGTTFVVVFVFVSVLTDWLHSFCSVISWSLSDKSISVQHSLLQ
jgi:hypothetical protein